MYREVAMVLAENRDKAVKEYSKVAFSEVQAIPYGMFFLLSLYIPSTNKMRNAREAISQLGISINAVGANDDTKYLNEDFWHFHARFCAEGNLQCKYQAAKDELAIAHEELLSTVLWPDGAKGRLASLRARCIAQRNEWENQFEYGQLYTMMKLLGAEE